MHPTLVRFSKASRAPLTPKRGNKDFYKGTRQAFLPGGHRTGAPGKHVIGGPAKYRLVDSQVRVYVAPPLEDILNSPLKPYVALGTNVGSDVEKAVWGAFRSDRGLDGKHFLRVAREHNGLETKEPPSWLKARSRLGLPSSKEKSLAVPGERGVSAGETRRVLEVVREVNKD